MELFTEKGYTATSLQDIATAVGCSKATVLYHFNGKPAVAAAVLEPAAKLVADLVAEAAQLPPAEAQGSRSSLSSPSSRSGSAVCSTC